MMTPLSHFLRSKRSDAPRIRNSAASIGQSFMLSMVFAAKMAAEKDRAAMASFLMVIKTRGRKSIHFRGSIR